MIVATLGVGTLLASCSDDDDEPLETQAPIINVEVQEDIVIITAEGEGEVKLYYQQSMEEAENPIIYGRDFLDYSVKFAATAKEEGKPISKTTVKEVVIPKSDAPKYIHAYSVIDNANDSTFFEFEFNLRSATGTIGVRKAVFDNSGNNSNETNFKIVSRVTFNQGTGIYSCTGTNIKPRFRSDGKDITIEGYTVTDLNCEVCIKDLTYKITFDCHGKHFDYNGSISKVYPITLHFTS